MPCATSPSLKDGLHLNLLSALFIGTLHNLQVIGSQRPKGPRGTLATNKFLFDLNLNKIQGR